MSSEREEGNMAGRGLASLAFFSVGGGEGQGALSSASSIVSLRVGLLGDMEAVGGALIRERAEEKEGIHVRGKK